MLGWIATGWLLGLFLGAQSELDWAPLLLALGLIGSLAIALHGTGLAARLWSLPLFALAFCAGFGVSLGASPPCLANGESRLRSRVESVRFGVVDARIRMRVVDGRLTESGLALPSGLLLSARSPHGAAPATGSIVDLKAELRPRGRLRNPSPHPDLSPSSGVGCWARWKEQSSMTVLSEPPWMSRIDRVRAALRTHMNDSLPTEVAGVARALVLGDGAALGYEQRRTIAAVGLAHLFAVSGLHVALVSGTLVKSLHWLFRGLTIRLDAKRLAAALGVPLTLLHAVFAGGSPSAWRAAITAALTWSLVAAGRRPSAPSVTATAALLLSAPDPSMALRPAFLLSIVATSSILSAPRAPADTRWPRLRSAATISARTLVATAPMVWWWFGGVPLIGWLTNILVLPLGSLVVIPLAHLFALTISAPGAAELLGSALTVAARVLLSVCDAFAPFTPTRGLPPPDVAQGLLLLCTCVLLLWLRTWRARALVLVVAALFWLGADQWLVAREQPKSTLRVTFMDVGQGDATLVDFPDGRLALIDTGRGGRHPAVRELRALLGARRRSRIDIVVLTHGHPDHYGGLSDLIGQVEIGEIWLNGQLLSEEEDGATARLVSSALARGTRLRFAPELCDADQEIGGVEVAVLWPCPRYDPALDLNDNSLTLRLAYGQRSFLFTGDLEREAELLLLDSGRIPASDVLQVGHHGSRTSSAPSFIAEVRPSLAVISCGAGNRYGHPSPSVVARLRAAGAEVHRTDQHGGLIVTTDGDRLLVRR
ncbi:MAG: DNA internalization-related competence protein ComEC/Rec2 [Polyangiales bacterium]